MEMISKKELLALTGISYGQLYRWKREALIPEEWFVKQASFTGQETFFPKEQVLARIKAIVELKEAHSLEELAALLAPAADTRIDTALLGDSGPRGRSLRTLLETVFKRSDVSVGEAALAFGLERLARTGAIPQEESAKLLDRSSAALDGIRLVETICTVFAVRGAFTLCFSRGPQPPVFDRDARVSGSFSLEEAANALKTGPLAGKK